MEAQDLAEKCRKILDKEGLTYTDRFGAPRARPEAKILNDSTKFTPPKHLSKESAEFFRKTVEVYDLDDHHLLLLTKATPRNPGGWS